MDNIIWPFVGGVLIAVSTTIMMLFNGKITGISGIVGTSLSKFSKEHYWRYFFIIGLIAGGFLMKALFPDLFMYEIKFSTLEAVAAGLLVGFGTRLGSGCTSGHGVCGLARFSKRSFVSVITFMAIGIVTVYIRSLL